MGYGFPHRPHRELSRSLKMFGRHPHEHHKEAQRVASPSFCKDFHQLLSIGSECLLPGIIRVIRSLVQSQFLHLVAELDGSLQSQSGTGGDPVQECLTTGFVDEGLNILNFALKGKRLRIRALASSPTVIGDDREVWRKPGC